MRTSVDLPLFHVSSIFSMVLETLQRSKPVQQPQAGRITTSTLRLLGQSKQLLTSSALAKCFGNTAPAGLAHELSTVPHNSRARHVTQ